jgi:hypothetical protein
MVIDPVEKRLCSYARQTCCKPHACVHNQLTSYSDRQMLWLLMSTVENKLRLLTSIDHLNVPVTA